MHLEEHLLGHIFSLWNEGWTEYRGGDTKHMAAMALHKLCEGLGVVAVGADHKLGVALQY